jgi:RHS repeat-associated protein
MTNRIDSAASAAYGYLAKRCLYGMLLTLSLCIGAKAQGSTTTSATDGSTPVALTAGAPAGAFQLSGFDNVNLFNGNLAVNLPLLHISGRGDAEYTMMLQIKTHPQWRVRHITVPYNCGQNGCQINHLYLADFAWWGPSSPGYGPGTLFGRSSGDTPQDLGCGSVQDTRTITRLSFTAADGTEFELIDQAHAGQPLPNTGCSSNLSRGTVFVTVDGTSAIFTSDTVIYDLPGIGANIQYLSGFLMFRNGVRYRIDSSQVTWVRDRNGNMLNFGYTNGLLTSITDSLRRVVNIDYNQTDTDGLFDRIRFTGFGGTQRTIQVRYYRLQETFPDGMTVLRPGDAQQQSAAQLFPTIANSGTGPLNGLMTAAVVLPDGRQHRFRYNKFEELWRIQLPTGGAIEYDHGPGLGTSSTGVVGNASSVTGGELGIYRRVVERRVYNDGVNVEGKMVYTEATNTDGTTTIVTADHQDIDGTSLAKDEHKYFGRAISSLTTLPALASVHDAWIVGKEFTTKAYEKLNGSQLRQADTTWSQQSPSWWTGGSEGAPPNNPIITDVITTLTDVTPNLVSRQHYEYNQFFNPSLVEEYDFGSSTPGIKIRTTETTYEEGSNYANPNGVTTTNPNLRSLPTMVTIKDGNATIKAQTTFEYDNYTATTYHTALAARASICGLDSSYVNPTTGASRRGNITKVSRWLDTTGLTLNSYSQYDVAGNVIKIIDPRSTALNIIATTFSFSDNYGAPDDEAQQNTPPTELGTSFISYAFPTQVTNPLGHTAHAQFDYYLGRPVNSDDANGIVAKGRYDDLLDRPTGLDVGIFSGSQLQRHTSFVYSDSSHLITTQSDQTTLNDGVLTGTILYDGLGRTTETRTSAPEGTIYATQQYDAMGRVKRSYNPYRTTSETTYGYADTTYDGLGRVSTVTTSDGAVVTTSYSANTTTVTDQATRQRRSITDGLGRLLRIDEPDSTGSLGTVAAPTQPTSYAYDVLDDLTTVTQGTQPSRSFLYDSLRRLTDATNPESGHVQYTYFNNGDLQTKTDANSITTTYAYDSLGRVTKRTYTGDPLNTPEVDYYYDNQTLPPNKPPNFTPTYSIGRLTAACYGGPTSSAGNYQSYDQLGRVTSSYQQTDSLNYAFTYGYNVASEMTSETYPSGRVVQTEYDTGGRITGVRNQDATSYYAGAVGSDATNRIQYSAHGAVSVMKLGNSKWEHTNFNNRLQPTQIGLGTSATDSSILKLDYGYGTTTNNGNVISQTITTPSLTLTQCYVYDYLNRLSTADEHSGTTCAGSQQWKQAFAYDRFGNRNFDAVNTTGNVLGPNPTISQSTNRIASGQSYGYDTGGNLTSDPTTPVNGIVYDPENRQTQYTKTGQATNYYFYDGDSHRVKKIDGSGTTVFVYNMGGQLIAEYTSGTPSGGGTSYLTSDHLGSTRVVMKSDGTTTRHDFLPFGEEIQAGIGARTAGQGYVTDSARQKFTQKERDNESGLDYFLARYYSSAQGRFTSVDPGSFTPADPQNWNRYTYVQNNPLKFFDPNGKELFVTGDDADYIVAELARFSGLTLSRDKKTGKVNINKRAAMRSKGISTTLAAILDTVIGDKDHDVTLETTTEVLSGNAIDFDRIETHQLDTDDYKVIRRDAPELAAAFLGHTIREYHIEARLKPSSEQDRIAAYKVAHPLAVNVESRIISDFTRKTEQPRTNQKGGSPDTIRFVYTSVSYDIKMKSGLDKDIVHPTQYVSVAKILNKREGRK